MNNASENATLSTKKTKLSYEISRAVNSAEVLEEAIHWHTKGFQPIPTHLPNDVKSKGDVCDGKEPQAKGWTKANYDLDKIKKLFNQECNISIRIENGLFVFDIENPLLGTIAKKLVPNAYHFLRGGHVTKLLFNCADLPKDAKKIKFDVSKFCEDKLILELLPKGLVVTPPSLHKTNEIVTWGNLILDDEPMPTMDYAALQRLASDMVCLYILVRRWDSFEGARHDLTGALTGALLHAGRTTQEVELCMGILLECVGEDHLEDRRCYVVDTIQCFQDDSPCSGFPKLETLLDDKKLSNYLKAQWNLGGNVLNIKGVQKAPPDKKPPSKKAALRKKSADKAAKKTTADATLIQTALTCVEPPAHLQGASQAPTSSTTRKINLMRASNVQMQPVSWLWEGRLARKKLNLITGNPGLGKTLIALTMAATVSSGGAWPDGDKCEQGEVLILSAEDDIDDTLTPRLVAAGADLNNISFITGVTEGVVKDSEYTLSDVAALDAILASNPTIKLIVIDPMSSFVDSKTNANNESDVRGLLRPIKNIMEKYDVALLMVMHPNKSSDQHTVHRTSGAAAWTGVPRVTYWVMESHEDPDTRMMLANKCNLSKNQAGMSYEVHSTYVEGVGDMPIIEWTDCMIMVSANDYMQSKTKESPVLEEAMNYLDEFLKDGAKYATEIQDYFKGAGISKSTLDRAKVALGIKPKRVGGIGSEGAWSWELPNIT